MVNFSTWNSIAKDICKTLWEAERERQKTDTKNIPLGCEDTPSFQDTGQNLGVLWGERKGEDWQGRELASTQTLWKLMTQAFLNYLVSVCSTEIGKKIDDSVNDIKKITYIFGNKLCFNFDQSPFVHINSTHIK